MAEKKEKELKIQGVKTKAEFVKHLTEVVKTVELNQKMADEILKKVFDIVAASIKKNEKIQIHGFGTFALAKRKARKGRNPRTKEEIKIKASKTVRFKPSAKIKKGL